MKPMQILTLVAGLILTAGAVKADVTTQYSKLNFSLMVKQQGPTNSVGSTASTTVTTARLANKDILAFLAAAIPTNWPAGAQLEFDWDTNVFNVIVADKSGSNILYYCDNSTNTYLFLNFYQDQDVFSGKSTPSGGTISGEQVGYFNLVGGTSTDLTADGKSLTKYSGNIAAGKWTESDSFSLYGDGYLNNTWSVISGTVTASGKGAITN